MRILKEDLMLAAIKLRKEKGLSHEDVANVIGSTKMSVYNYERYYLTNGEKGNDIPLQKFVKYCELVGLKVVFD